VPMPLVGRPDDESRQGKGAVTPAAPAVPSLVPKRKLGLVVGLVLASAAVIGLLLALTSA
jgi:hypothetical protein